MSAATVPVALALSEKTNVTGRDFLAAVVVGCEELRNKFRKLARSVLADSRIDEIIDTINRLEKLDDAVAVARLLVR